MFLLTDGQASCWVLSGLPPKLSHNTMQPENTYFSIRCHIRSEKAKYLKRGWNRKEGRGNKDFKKGDKLGQGVGASKRGWTATPLGTMNGKGI